MHGNWNATISNFGNVHKENTYIRTILVYLDPNIVPPYILLHICIPKLLKLENEPKYLTISKHNDIVPDSEIEFFFIDWILHFL